MTKELVKPEDLVYPVISLGDPDRIGILDYPEHVYGKATAGKLTNNPATFLSLSDGKKYIANEVSDIRDVNVGRNFIERLFTSTFQQAEKVLLEHYDTLEFEEVKELLIEGFSKPSWVSRAYLKSVLRP